MSRSGYDDDCDGWALIRWRGAVSAAIKGKRGQKLLKELAAALDAMPEKRLIAEQLEESPKGEVCALGCLGRVKGIPIAELDPEEPEQIAKAFDIAPALAREIVYVNDDYGWQATPEQRWKSVRQWVEEKLQ